MMHKSKAKFDEPLSTFFSSNSVNQDPFKRKYVSKQDDDEIL